MTLPTVLFCSKPLKRQLWEVWTYSRQVKGFTVFLPCRVIYRSTLSVSSHRQAQRKKGLSLILRLRPVSSYSPCCWVGSLEVLQLPFTAQIQLNSAQNMVVSWIGNSKLSVSVHENSCLTRLYVAQACNELTTNSRLPPLVQTPPCHSLLSCPHWIAHRHTTTPKTISTTNPFHLLSLQGY